MGPQSNSSLWHKSADSANFLYINEMPARRSFDSFEVISKILGSKTILTHYSKNLHFCENQLLFWDKRDPLLTNHTISCNITYHWQQSEMINFSISSSIQAKISAKINISVLLITTSDQILCLFNGRFSICGDLSYVLCQGHVRQTYDPTHIGRIQKWS